MVEGDLWRYAHTDLTDFYRGALTLRQVWVRFRSIARDESATWAAIDAEQAADETRQKSKDIDDVMRMVGGGPRA